jgi:MFS family permease
MRQMITRIYSHYASADQAIRNLRAAGLPGSAISILASDSQGWHEPGGSNVDPRHDKDRDGRDDRAQGALTGGTIGVVLGAALGLALGFGLIAMPGVDRVIAAAWYAPIFIGAVLLGTLGGLIGALVESRVSRENTALYTEALRRGGALVTARVKKNEVEIYSVIMDTSAVDAEQRIADPLVANDPTLSGISPGEMRAPRDNGRGNGYDLGRTG